MNALEISLWAYLLLCLVGVALNRKYRVVPFYGKAEKVISRISVAPFLLAIACILLLGEEKSKGTLLQGRK